MLGVDGHVFRIAWTVLLAAGLLWLLYLLRGALFVFILAVLFAYVIWPLVAITEQWFTRVVPAGRAARLSALAVVYPLLLGVAVLMGTVVAPEIAHQAATLVEKTTTLAGRIQQGGILEQMSQKKGWSLPALYAIRDQLLQHTGSLVPYLQSAVRQLLHYLSNLWLVVVVPILAFFLLKDAESLVGGVEGWLIAREHREFMRNIFTDLHVLLAQYMRALILLSLLTFVSHLLFFVVAGVPYAMLLATVAGMLEFIPLVGPLSAAALIVLASWLAGFEHLVWILIFLGAWRLIQDYVNMPWLLGSGVELHPLLVIFGILAGAELAGVAGMFLSIPIMATVRVVVRRGIGRASTAAAREVP